MALSRHCVARRVPRRAPRLQVVIVPIVKKEVQRVAVAEAAAKLQQALKGAGIRVKVRHLFEYAGASGRTQCIRVWGRPTHHLLLARP